MSETKVYYADKALPVCDVRQHRMTTQPPAGRPMKDSKKGNFLMADRDVAAGEIVGMDTSWLTIISDPTTFRFPPLDLDAWKGATAATGQKDGERCFYGTGAVQLLAQRMLINALQLKRGKDELVDSGRIQCLCSVLVELGDDLTIPRRADYGAAAAAVTGEGTEATQSAATGAVQKTKRPLYTRLDEQRSHRSEAVIESMLSGWWASSGSDEAAYERIAQLLLRCTPPQLLWSKELPCGIQGWGFFSRIGFNNPKRLGHFLAVCDGNGLDLQCPRLGKRVGLFPFVRLAEHECRPNCTVMLLDSPVTHTFDTAGHASYDTNTQPREGESKEAARRRGLVEQYSKLWREPTSQRLFKPSVVVLVAARNIRVGDPLSISYVPSTYMTQPQRLRELQQRFQFECTCRWCTTEPDLARGFRCQACPEGMGVVCPTGDGTKLDEWMCLQCGDRPDAHRIQQYLDREALLLCVKADKASGLARLVGDDLVHYTHALVFKKLDAWSEAAWKEQDGNMCIQYIETLQKCMSRVLDQCDPARSLYCEFLGQVNHALGNAHTARLEYFMGYQTRLRAGHRYAHWSRCTRFMAAEKSLADFLDSK